MRNASIAGADRATHLKVVAVSLVASIVVVFVTIAARTLPDPSVERTQVVHGPVIKATKTIVTTNNDTSVIR